MRQRFSAFRNRVLRPGMREQPAPPAEETGRWAGATGAGRGTGQTRGVSTATPAITSAHGASTCSPAATARSSRGTARWDAAAIAVDGRALQLARPRVQMNECGPPVAAEARRLRLTTPQLLIVYDDIDLPAGQVRIRPHGGHGGHNGVRSLLDALGDGDFARVRIGIDRPYDGGEPVRDPDRVADWVLSAPAAEERARLDRAVGAGRGRGRAGGDRGRRSGDEPLQPSTIVGAALAGAALAGAALRCGGTRAALDPRGRSPPPC